MPSVVVCHHLFTNALKTRSPSAALMIHFSFFFFFFFHKWTKASLKSTDFKWGLNVKLTISRVLSVISFSFSFPVNTYLCYLINNLLNKAAEGSEIQQNVTLHILYLVMENTVKEYVWSTAYDLRCCISGIYKYKEWKSFEVI